MRLATDVAAAGAIVAALFLGEHATELDFVMF